MRDVLGDHSRRLHRLARRTLKLAPTAPDPSPIVFTPTGDGYSSVMLKAPDQVAADTEAWHAEPRRGRIVDALFARVDGVIGCELPPALPRSIKHLQADQRRRRALDAIMSAPRLQWLAYHWAGAGESPHIDGRLVAGQHTLPFDISCVGDLQGWARESVSYGSVLEDRGERRVRQLVLPTMTLGRGMIESALALWYMEHASYRQGHWAITQRTLPVIDVDQPWEDDSPRTPAAAAAERAAIEAFNAELQVAAGTDGVVRGWARHGVELEDLLVPMPS